MSSETTPAQEPPPPYPTVADFCAKLAEVVCNDEVVEVCYGSDDASLEQDKQSCVAAFMTTPRCNPNIPYHHEGAEACIAAWQEVYADASVSAEQLEEAEEACLETFYDELGILNMDCVYDHECDVMAGLTCVVKPGAASGTCQELDEVAGGYPCDDIDQLCITGFYCDPESNACLARKGVGQSCDTEILCQESALCSAPVDGTCEAKLANNEDCTADEQCTGGLCNKASGSAEGVCAATIPLYQNGAVCDDFK